ncbi:carbonic anhydrase-like [Clavelina lepadiformis]|uniref:carbonic anhydrase-like n=1 Tax=Clavelina lepadiformis TaxID=159417 RepID=UPI0040436A73
MNILNTLFFVAVVGILADATLGASWSYGDIPAWATNYATCATQQQSPIDIVHDDAIVDTTLGDFTHALFDAPPQTMTIKNPGYTVQIDLTGGYTIDDPSLLSGVFKAAQFHLHWGNSSSAGSEHLFNGNQYWGELHIVHYNTKYPDLGTAANESDGLAVLGFFITKDYPQDNTAVQRMIQPLTEDRVNYNSESESYTTTFSMETFLPNNISVYYRYQGSLTTPPCYESVMWTVFSEPIRISTAQANIFETRIFSADRGTSNPDLVNNNYRPAQLLNGRTVFRSTQCSGTGSFSMPTFHFVALCATVIGLIIVR